MTPLKQACGKIAEIIDKYREELEGKYLNVDLSYYESGVYLTCLMENNEKITLRVIADNTRNTFTPPMNLKEHIEQGGHKGVIENIQKTNPDAWKIEVKQTIKNQIMEIAFSGSENNWNTESFEREFVSTIVNRI